MLVKILNLEDNEVITTLSLGHHVLGRGENLKCADKRVSRSHIELTVTKDKVILTSIHVNPSFFMCGRNNKVSMLKPETPQNLKDGDKFGFLPDKYWFKIQILPDEKQLNGKLESLDKKGEECDEDVSTSTSRDKADAGNSTKNDKTKTTANTPENQKNDSSSSKNKKTDDDTSKDIVPGNEKKNCSQDSIKEIHKTDVDQKKNDSDNKSDSGSQTASQSTFNDPKEGVPGTSSDKPKDRRDRCWYGAGCYRKNADHRDELSHPGDSDFESDPDDNRPACQFGGSCYRKNKLHRKQLKHPSGPPPKKICRRRAAAAKKAPKDDDLNDSEDDYDYDDPFLDDGDSDEYEPDSPGDDTDWEDSQEVDEGSEDISRLLKETKGFSKRSS